MADELLLEVRAAAAALAQAEARRLAAVHAAFTAGRNRAHIAEAAGITRDGVYKMLRNVEYEAVTDTRVLAVPDALAVISKVPVCTSVEST